MLGIAAERFPKGGALTLNAIGGMGMLSVGVIGAVFLGNIQDKQIDRELFLQSPGIHQKVVAEEKSSVFGKYSPLDQDKIASLGSDEKLVVDTIKASAKKNALLTVAIFPAIMLACYLILILYFRAKGGYKAEELTIQME
jgi:hypothetical protein